MKKVLICEKETLVRVMLRDCLSDLGFMALGTNCIKGCARWLADFEPDVLILDAHLPYCDAPKALKKLKEIGCNIPIILTGTHEEMRNFLFDNLFCKDGFFFSLQIIVFNN